MIFKFLPIFVLQFFCKFVTKKNRLFLQQLGNILFLLLVKNTFWTVLLCCAVELHIFRHLNYRGHNSGIFQNGNTYDMGNFKDVLKSLRAYIAQNVLILEK